MEEEFNEQLELVVTEQDGIFIICISVGLKQLVEAALSSVEALLEHK
jgi:hypothetical protein